MSNEPLPECIFPLIFEVVSESHLHFELKDVLRLKHEASPASAFVEVLGLLLGIEPDHSIL